MSGVKQSLYFPRDMLEEMKAEGKRLDRSMSWVVSHAFAVALEQLRAYPAASEILRPRAEGSARR